MKSRHVFTKETRVLFNFTLVGGVYFLFLIKGGLTEEEQEVTSLESSGSDQVDTEQQMAAGLLPQSLP